MTFGHLLAVWPLAVWPFGRIAALCSLLADVLRNAAAKPDTLHDQPARRRARTTKDARP